MLRKTSIHPGVPQPTRIDQQVSRKIYGDRGDSPLITP